MQPFSALPGRAGSNIHASSRSSIGSLVCLAHSHRHGGTRFYLALDSSISGHHMGWTPLLLQSGERSIHETGGCRHQAESVSIHDAATLQWFRWSAMVTVFVGFWYWSQIYVAADARRMGVTPGSTIGFFLLIWI